jgi:SEC-C motif-containing protein
MTVTGNQCPCSSTLPYSKCCEPFHNKKAFPDTAEKLMRSRYSAFQKKLLHYLIDTHHPEHFNPLIIEEIQESFNTCAWQKLSIISSHKGGVEDNDGTIEFRAHYAKDGTLDNHHEISYFIRIDGKWYYQEALK